MFDLNNNVIIMATALQYRTENVNMVFKLIVILSKSQLRLKIEEYLIISVMVFLFICIIVPIQAVKIINKKIVGFQRKITR